MILLLIFIPLLLLICISLLTLSTLVLKKIKVSKKQLLFTFITIIILIIIILVTINIFKHLPHNMVSLEERESLETYIFEKYQLKVKVTESEIVHRGNIGDNPGSAYFFILKSDKDFKYSLYINTYVDDINLKTILQKNPELDLIQIK